MADLLGVDDLPARFEYPREFIRIVELGLIDLEPWSILGGDRLRWRSAGLAERYPTRVLVPFAERQDNDDVACFEVGRPGPVVVHDFASPGWESRESFPDFYSWLRRAVDDLIDFG